ncbi:hypothetical protein RHGRI_002022 [Rhododendron griersonianum]|uniref:Uncharacterized protein n=1 Tax=Rhododendron griersonianum TaxID=479676 RepID=A0AAV6LNJ9_9ERIC|nr:hypothetical protein RHGRI_002022 [Rhododendron griersonianum]
MLERDYSSGAKLSDKIPAVLRSDPQVREYLRQLNDWMAKKDRMINALRKDVHMVATAIRLRTLSPSRDRYRSSSPCQAEGKTIHVKECLVKRVTPERRHREEVYERRPARAVDPPVEATPKAPQTKVEMVLEQLVSSPFADFREYLQDLVRKGHLSQYIDQEKTKEKARKLKTLGAGGSTEVGQSSKPVIRIINVIHGMVDAEAEA